MKLRTRIFGVVVATLLLAAPTFAIKVGETAPAFTLLDSQGNSHSLSDFAGKVVVLEWTNYGCPFVKKHYSSGNMQALQETAAGKEIVWLSVCSSAPGKQGHMSPDGWNEAIDSKGVKAAAVLIDEDGAVGRAYNAAVTPHIFIIDETGMLAYNGAIDSIPSTSASDIEKADNFVMAAIDSLIAGKPIEVTMAKPYGCGVKYAR